MYEVEVTALDNGGITVTQESDGTVTVSQESNGVVEVDTIMVDSLALMDLSDVSILTPANNDCLMYDTVTGTWKNKAGGSASGDMLKSVYDTDDDGRVDKAESVDDGTNVSSAVQVKGAVDHVPLTNNPHVVTQTQVGLGNVTNVAIDNTAYSAGGWDGILDGATKEVLREKFVLNDAAIALNTAKNSYPSADAVKVGFISVTQAVNLDTIESDTALNNTHRGRVDNPHTVTQAQVGLGNVTNVAIDDTAYNPTSWNNVLDGATKKVIRNKFVLNDSAIALNTAKNSYPSGDQTKVNFLSVTQAVNLDTMESDIALNNTKRTYPLVDETKLIGIENNADVTDAINVNAAGATMVTDTDVSGTNWVLDEDSMSSDSDTKVPTQQSVKAYVDNSISAEDYWDRTGTTVTLHNASDLLSLSGDLYFSAAGSSITFNEANNVILTASDDKLTLANDFTVGGKTFLQGKTNIIFTDTTTVSSASLLAMPVKNPSSSFTGFTQGISGKVSLGGGGNWASGSRAMGLEFQNFTQWGGATGAMDCYGATLCGYSQESGYGIGSTFKNAIGLEVYPANTGHLGHGSGSDSNWYFAASENLYGIYVADSKEITSKIYRGIITCVDAIGIFVEKYSTVTASGVQAQIVLEGNGTGTGIWFNGVTGERLYSDGTDLRCDASLRPAGYKSSDGSAGLSATYTFGGGASGDIATMTFKNGILTAITTVP